MKINDSRSPHAARRLTLVAPLTLLLTLPLAWPAIAAPEDSGGWTPMFNGRDLTGWVPISLAPGTFSVRDGLIVTTGVPTGLMRTERQYENFEMELDWRHLKPAGNSGVFLWADALPRPGSPFPRGMEVQVLDPGFNVPGKNQWYTVHGDVFPVGGATMTPTGRTSTNGQRSFPSEDRTKSSPEWNHYHIIATNGVIRLSVNGKEVTVGGNCVPRKGYLCLESEGSECHFRNVRLRELPSTNPTSAETAHLDEGFRPLYTGTDLSGWKTDPGHVGHWQPKDWILFYDGKSQAHDKNLWTEKEFADFTLICDWRWTRKPVQIQRPVLLPNGDEAGDADGKITAEVLDAGDSGIYLRGSSKSQVNIWCWPAGSGEVYGYRTDRNLPPAVRAAVTPKKKADQPIGQWNRFIITLRGDRLTVVLNGETVIANAQLPGVPAKGPIALQHHGDPIEFANIFIKELDSPSTALKEPTATPLHPESQESTSTREELEARFKATLTRATLAGRWCPITDAQLGPDKADRYTILGVAKIGADSWLINARIQYGTHDFALPVPVKVKWAGDTPVITVDNFGLPGGNSYSARVLIYGHTYAGTWSGGDHAGLLHGCITNDKP